MFFMRRGERAERPEQPILEEAGEPLGSEDRLDQAYETADRFLERKYSAGKETLDQLWDERYAGNPTTFFDKQHAQKLREMDPTDRLLLLSYAAYSLESTPAMMEGYLKAFPEDLDAIMRIFRLSGNRAASSFDFFLYSLAAPQMVEHDASIQDASGIQQYREMSERRQGAPTVLLNGYHNLGNENYKEFGKGAEGIREVLQEASKLSMTGEYVIDPNKMFTSEFEEMSDADKAKLLRTTIAELHTSLLFDETFNSCFTRERVAEDKRRALAQGGESDYFVKMPRHNPAHSMIYGTYQPISVFDLDQSFFQREMDSTADIGGSIEEYPYHRLLLSAVERLGTVEAGSGESVDLIVDFWNKNRNPIFGNTVADALSRLNPNRAASRLLELLRKEKENKNPLAAILCRLEFGQIDISEDGVKYLERLYDLGEYNNPDFFVQRLTASGQMGIFGEDRILQKFFHLGDLSSDERKVKAAVLDFTLEQFFSLPVPEGTEEKKVQEEIMEEFKQNYFAFYDDEFFKETGVRFNNLSFREQAWFMRFVLHGTEQEQKKALNLVKEYGEAGLKTFLSLELDTGAGDKIFAIAEKFKGEAAEKIFRKYEAIAHLGNEIEIAVQEFFVARGRADQVSGERVTQEIIKRAGRILANFADMEASDAALDDIDRELDNIKEDAVMFSSIFKTAFKGKEDIDFADVRGLDFSRIPIADLSDEEKKDMLGISKANWLPRGAAGKGVVEEFERTLRSGKDVEFSVLKKDGKVLSFTRFDRIRDESGRIVPDRKYWGSFNVDPQYRGSAVGEAMLQNAVEREAEDYVLEATVSPKIVVGTDYVEKRGFRITDVLPNYDNSGETFFEIILDKKRNPEFATKDAAFSQDRIISMYESLYKGRSLDELLERDVIVARFDVDTELDPALAATERLIKEGYAGARYFTDPKNEHARYWVFERRMAEEAEEKEAA